MSLSTPVRNTLLVRCRSKNPTTQQRPVLSHSDTPRSCSLRRTFREQFVKDHAHAEHVRLLPHASVPAASAVRYHVRLVSLLPAHHLGRHVPEPGQSELQGSDLELQCLRSELRFCVAIFFQFFCKACASEHFVTALLRSPKFLQRGTEISDFGGQRFARLYQHQILQQQCSSERVQTLGQSSENTVRLVSDHGELPKSKGE